MRIAIGIGITILVIMLGGVGSIGYLERTAADIASQLNEIQRAVQVEDWEQAQQQVATLFEQWNKVADLWSAIINHREVDEIRMAFHRAREYVTNEDKASALAELAVAKFLVVHVPEKEKPTLSNIF